MFFPLHLNYSHQVSFFSIQVVICCGLVWQFDYMWRVADVIAMSLLVDYMMMATLSVGLCDCLKLFYKLFKRRIYEKFVKTAFEKFDIPKSDEIFNITNIQTISQVRDSRIVACHFSGICYSFLLHLTVGFVLCSTFKRKFNWFQWIGCCNNSQRATDFLKRFNIQYFFYGQVALIRI